MFQLDDRDISMTLTTATFTPGPDADYTCYRSGHPGS